VGNPSIGGQRQVAASSKPVGLRVPHFRFTAAAKVQNLHAESAVEAGVMDSVAESLVECCWKKTFP